MNPITVLIDAGTLLIAILATGCGRVELPTLPEPTPTVAMDMSTPTPTPTVTPTATPTPNPTTVTYIYQAVTICNALHNWNPNTTAIKTYPTSGNFESNYFVFRWDGVWQVTDDGCAIGHCRANITLVRESISSVICTITVVNGVMTGVTP